MARHFFSDPSSGTVLFHSEAQQEGRIREEKNERLFAVCGGPSPKTSCGISQQITR